MTITITFRQDNSEHAVAVAKSLYQVAPKMKGAISATTRGKRHIQLYPTTPLSDTARERLTATLENLGYTTITIHDPNPHHTFEGETK